MSCIARAELEDLWKRRRLGPLDDYDVKKLDQLSKIIKTLPQQDGQKEERADTSQLSIEELEALATSE